MDPRSGGSKPGAPKGGAPKGAAPKGGGRQNFALFTLPPHTRLHDNPRTQTCTFQGPASKHHQNSTKGPPEREEKNEFCGGRGKKKSEILGGPGEGRSSRRAVLGKGGPRGHRTRHHETVKPTPTYTHTTHHTTPFVKVGLAKVGHDPFRAPTDWP